MKPYYEHGMNTKTEITYCLCGCGQEISSRRKYVSGHNLRGLVRTEAHCRNIGKAQKEAWKTKRQRMSVGATYKDSYGYVREKVVEGSGRWPLQHKLVIERHIGRPLGLGETVHHINGVRDDNRIENLFLCRGHAHHMEVERSLVEVFRSLLADGHVAFNAERGCYERVL